jgi:predicted methyltransferase
MGRRPRPLTAIAHDAVRQVLKPGDRAIDATAGNGRDTLFLATTVAPDGRVMAFDIQAAAIENTGRLLRETGLDAMADLRLVGHERLADTVPPDWPGTVAAVMFNLGYLPGGDHTLITRAATTISALDAASRVLAPGGVLSVLLYPDHDGAADEVGAVRGWIRRLPNGWRVDTHASPGPILFLARSPRTPADQSIRRNS